MMAGIAVGTLCWIIRAEPGNEHYVGRVVTVVAPLQPMAQRGGQLYHRIDAPWMHQERHHLCCYTRESSLRPIAGPDKTSPAPRERVPETA